MRKEQNQKVHLFRLVYRGTSSANEDTQTFHTSSDQVICPRPACPTNATHAIKKKSRNKKNEKIGSNKQTGHLFDIQQTLFVLVVLTKLLILITSKRAYLVLF